MTSDLAISKGSILIVDDSPENLRVLSSTLARQEYVVRCVTDSQMAMVSIQNVLPDLILLDIRMPHKDGFEFCQELKADPKTRDIPVIFLSALSDVSEIVKAFHVGGVDYITKPFRTEEVLARINSQFTIQKLKTQLLEQNQTLKQEIDERKKIEFALRQEIQNRIVVEAALQDAKEAAAAASDAKSKFLSQMSHELRTPLNAILGFTNLLQQEVELQPEHMDYLRTVHQSGHRLLKLINNILTVTSVEANQLTIHNQILDLHKLLDTLTVLWRSKAAEKGLKLILEKAASVPQYIQADERKLRQVLMNLLENAYKFTQSGSINVKATVDLTYQDQELQHSGPSCLLQLTIADTGLGIASDEVAHLFQVFAQTESGRKSGQGAGLGLLISHQFIQLMGGTITLNSTPGQGTTVSVNLPVQIVTGELMPTSDSDPIPLSGGIATSLGADLTRETLQTAMSIDWITQLHHAAVKGFDQQILSLIQEIPSSHAVLAKSLTDWTRNFQFERIEQLTGQILN